MSVPSDNSSSLTSLSPDVADTQSAVDLSNTLKCSQCSRSFPTKNCRKHHVACVHQQHATINTSPTTTIVIERDSTGKFQCPADGCPQPGVDRASLLAKHFKRRHWKESSNEDSLLKPKSSKRQSESNSRNHQIGTILNFNTSETPANILPTLLRRTTLENDGNSVVFLVCTGCKHVLPPIPQLVINHLQDHQDLLPRKMKRQRLISSATGNLFATHDASYPTDSEITDFISGGGFTDHDSPVAKAWLLPSTPLHSLMPPIPGVNIVSGYQCTDCGTCVMSKNSIRCHRCSAGRHDFQAVMLQEPLGGIGRKFVRVQYNNPQPIDHSELSAQIQHDLDLIDSLTSTELPSHKQRNPWMRASKWPELAEAIIPKEAKYDDIVACIEPGENSPMRLRLDTLVTSYMKTYVDVAGRIDHCFLRQVMGKDENGCIPTRGLHPLREETTSARYCRYLRNLIHGLLCADDPDETDKLHLLGQLDNFQSGKRAELFTLLKTFDSEVSNTQGLLQLHCFLLSLWTPEESTFVNVQEASDSIVMRYLLLSSLTKNHSDGGYGFQHVSTVPGRCSIFFYWIRVTILLEIGLPLWIQPTEGEEFKMTKERKTVLLRYVNDDASGTPYSIVRGVKRLAATISDGEHPADVLQIADIEGRCAIQGGNSLSIDNVSEMLKAMHAHLTETMRTKIFYGLDTSWLNRLLADPNLKLLDNIRSKKIGYNFISANPTLNERRRDLINHLFQSRMTQSGFIHGKDDDGAIAYNRMNILKLLDTGDYCFMMFAKALHISAGEPMRGDEYASLNVIHTETRDRAFFWNHVHKTIYIWQTYVKTEGFAAPVKHILRLVSPDWLEMFFLLEVLVRPALVFLAYHLWPDDNHQLAYNYKTSWLVKRGIPVDGKAFSTSLNNSFVDHVGFEVGLAKWRHWAVFFGDYVQKLYGYERNTLPLDEQAGHSKQTAAKSYAICSSIDVRGLDRHTFDKFCAASRAWHTVFGCDSLRPWDHSNRKINSSDHQRQRQNEPTSATQIVNLDTTQASSGSDATIVSEAVVEPVVEHNTVVSQVKNPHQSNAISEPPVNIHHSIMAYKTMRQLGFHGWRCQEQANAAGIIVENERDLGVILPTGSGKSLLFHIPALLFPEKCTVVIVFLAELRALHLMEAEKAGISTATIYNGLIEDLDLHHPPSLLILGPEQADDQRFVTAMKCMVNLGTLFAVFFDEGHLLLETYRGVMKRLFPLGGIGAPFIVTTATLEPGREYDVEVMVGRKLCWIRRTTVRSNIQYSVDLTPDIDEKIISRLQHWQNNRSDPNERAIIYCFTVAEVNRIHHFLESKGFSAGMGHSQCDRASNAEQRKLFEDGVFLILVTTSVLGCGYNYQRVTLVIHRSMVRSIRDYVQQSGRAGRNGEPAESVFVTNQREVEFWVDRIKDDGSADIGQVREYVMSNDKCRRWMLHNVVDGVPATCFLVADSKPSICDICQSDPCSIALPNFDSEKEKNLQPGKPRQQEESATVGTAKRSTPSNYCQPSPAQPQRSHSVQQSSQEQPNHWSVFPRNPYKQLAPQQTRLGAEDSNVTHLAAQQTKKLAVAKQTALATIRLLGYHDRCLMCYLKNGKKVNHTIFKCPTVVITSGICCRCLGDHDRKNCPNVKYHQDSQCCFKCGLSFCRLGSKGDSEVEPHPGLYGKDCQYEIIGDQLRLLVWSIWRNRVERNKLFNHVPMLRVIKDDNTFAAKLYKKEQGECLPLFHQIVGMTAKNHFA